jgi:uncharacterized membrane protein YccF (DUF307 family)
MLNPLNDELERRSQFGRQADTNHGANNVSSVTNVFKFSFASWWLLSARMTK